MAFQKDSDVHHEDGRRCVREPHMIARVPCVFALLAAPAACARPAAPLPTLAPDLGKRLVARNGVVASAHPLASEAGLTVLQEGGNAVDAAVATAFAIGVAEPEMSGVGGSGAMLIWRQREGRAEFLDFYASQPVSSFRAAKAVGRDAASPLRVVAVPGNVAGLLLAQARFGRLTRPQVMAPAIRLAEEGYPMYPVLAGDDRRATRTSCRAIPSDAICSCRTAAPWRLASTSPTRHWRACCAASRPTAPRDSTRVTSPTTSWPSMNAGGHPVRPRISPGTSRHWRRPLCGAYNGRVILSAPPPEGGMQMLTTVKLLDPAKAASFGLPTRDPRAFDLFTSALRVGQASARGNGDPRWEPVPARGVTSDGYVASRAAEIAIRSSPPRRLRRRTHGHSMRARVVGLRAVRAIRRRTGDRVHPRR